MSTNPFEDANALVGGLRTEYEELTKVIPKLRETKKGSLEELSQLNGQIVEAQTKLEGLKTTIKERTEAFNKWQAAELAKVNTAKNELKTDKLAFEGEKADHARQAKEQADIVGGAKTDVQTAQEQIRNDGKELVEQRAVNDKWAKNLTDKELDLKNREADLSAKTSTQDTKEAELTQREQKVAGAEQEAKELIQAAERDRDSAKTLLEGAKESIATNDARGQELDTRENILKGIAVKLNQKDAALKDKAGVIASR